MDMKSQMRMKAMDKMMKDKPSIAIKIKESPDGMEDGMISMPVTPEEKEMILSMRAEKEGSEEMSEEEYA
jgi:hypothetical protein